MGLETPWWKEISEWHSGRGWDVAETQTRVSLGLGEGWEGEHPIYLPPHCPVWCEKHMSKGQRDQRGESWSIWEIQTAEAEDIREAIL